MRATTYLVAAEREKVHTTRNFIKN